MTGGGDTVSYASSDRRVRVDLGDGTAGDDGSSNSGGHATGDTISGFENIRGTAYGDVLTALMERLERPAAHSGVSAAMTPWWAALVMIPWKAAPALMKWMAAKAVTTML